MGTAHEVAWEADALNEIAARRALLRAEDNCRAISPPIHLVDEVGRWSEDYVNEFLIEMGRGLGDAVRALYERDSSVYFWPGYARATGEGRTVVHRVVQGQQRLSGVGSFARDEHWEQDANALWYNKVLTPSALLDGFKPGSTHDWFENGKFGETPDLLAIEVVEEATDVAEIDELGEYGVRIALTRDSFGKWGTRIREGIAKIRKLRGFVECDGESWPSPSTGPDADQLRLAQYDVWLGGCFNPNSCTSEEFLEPINRALNNIDGDLLSPVDRAAYLGELRSVQGALVRGEIAVTSDNTEYRAWYAFRLFEPVGPWQIKPAAEDATAKRWLGTAMFLTTEHLDGPCLQLLSSWIRVMYMQLRQVERQIEAARDALQQSTAFPSRMWPKARSQYFHGELGEVPHTFSKMTDEVRRRAAKGFEAHLESLFGRTPKFDTESAAVHNALKGLLGFHAKAHRGAADAGVVDVIPGQSDSHAYCGLNIGSLALLLGAATRGYNEWLDSVVWPAGPGAFVECAWLQTPRQEFKLVLALAGMGPPEGLFRKLEFTKQKSAITKVELGWDTLKIYLAWNISAPKAPRPRALLDVWRYEGPDDWSGGEFVDSLRDLIDAMSRSGNGLRPRTLVKMEYDEQGTILEFKALPSAVWKNPGVQH